MDLFILTKALIASRLVFIPKKFEPENKGRKGGILILKRPKVTSQQTRATLKH